MKNISKKICVIVVASLVAIFTPALSCYHHQNKLFLNDENVMNEVFTENFFEGLI